jgi:uncharacterized protein YndB with AHSA1/START domain
MERQTFDIFIDAPREKVWDILWSKATYPEWTAAFSAGSRAETTWQQGSKVLFMDANNEGMVATIVENRPNEFMSLKHLGTIKDGVEDLDTARTKEWAGAQENYTLKTVHGRTQLTVEMDITQEYKEYFKNTWPKALDKVKELAEQSLVGKRS